MQFRFLYSLSVWSLSFVRIYRALGLGWFGVRSRMFASSSGQPSQSTHRELLLRRTAATIKDRKWLLP